MAAKAYFAALPSMISDQATEAMLPKGRTKHPPKDRFNCLLSYGYALLFGLVHRSLIAVGACVAIGATSAHTCAVMVTFRSSRTETRK